MNFIVGVCLLLLWNGILGGIYIRFNIPHREGHYIGRAIFFSLATWFILHALGTFYKIPKLDIVAWQTALSHWIGVTGFGIILGWLTKRWDKLEEAKEGLIS